MKNYGDRKDNLYPTTAQVLCLSMFDLLGTCRLSDSCRLPIDNDRFDRRSPMCGPIDRSSCRMSSDKIVSPSVFFSSLFRVLFFLFSYNEAVISSVLSFFPLTIVRFVLHFNLCASCPINWFQLFGILDLII